MLAEKPLAQAENLQKTVYCLFRSGLAARRRPGGGPAEAQRTGVEAAKHRGDALPWHLVDEARFKLGSSKSAPDILVPELGAWTPYRCQPQPSLA
jgi:hypothetical protein